MDKQRRPCAAGRCPNYGEQPGGFCTFHKDKYDHLASPPDAMSGEPEAKLYISRCGYCGETEGTGDPNEKDGQHREVCSASTPDEMHPHRFGVFEAALAPAIPQPEAKCTYCEHSRIYHPTKKENACSMVGCSCDGFQGAPSIPQKEARELLERALAKKYALMEETYEDDVEQIMDASLILQDAIVEALAAIPQHSQTKGEPVLVCPVCDGKISSQPDEVCPACLDKLKITPQTFREIWASHQYAYRELEPYEVVCTDHEYHGYAPCMDCQTEGEPVATEQTIREIETVLGIEKEKSNHCPTCGAFPVDLPPEGEGAREALEEILHLTRLARSQVDLAELRRVARAALASQAPAQEKP